MTDGTPDIESIFHQAQRIADPRERSEFIRRSSRGDARTERVLQELLQLWESLHAAGAPGPPAALMDTLPPTSIVTTERTAEGVGGIIGRYELLKILGEGGFGTVFLAEQREPVRRHVALKIVKAGMDTRQVIGRFEVERQALALMDHPNIAKVLDAGATGSGRPYFVMEFVPGVPITEYCDQHHLSIRERLQLFAQVCRAIRHAHTKGIIHRDLKPGNILVSTQEDHPLAKVIDFGIAKATHAAFTDRAVFTENYQLIGTPAYMSPEQADGSADIDTRSDVYSLGVLLYELLTGSTPFTAEELRAAGISEMHRIIREVEPPGPSARISSSPATLPVVAANRRLDPRRLHSLLRGELDWIVMKCLEKNRARRYDTAGGIATDIYRYLDGEAVLAAPPGASYRIQKFVRRHRTGVAAGVAILAALLVGLGAALFGLRSAALARDAEATAAARSRAALEFVTDMFGAVDPARARGHDVTVAEILDPASASVEGAFAGDVEGEAVVRHILGQAYTHLARYPEALRELERGLELRRSLGAPDDPETLSMLHDLGAAVLEAGDVTRARGLLQQAWEGRAARLGPSHRDTLESRSLLAYAKQLDGDLDDAIGDVRAVLLDQEASVGPRDRDTLESMCSLADMLASSGRPDEALRVAHDAASRAADALGPESDLALMASSIEAESLLTLSRYREAAALLERVVQGKERLHGPNHPETLVSMDLLARTLGNLLQHERAISIARSVVDRATEALGESHASTMTYMNNLAQLLRAAGRLDEAESMYRRVIALRVAQDGEHAQETLMVRSNLGLLLLQRGEPDEALPLFVEALEGLRATMPSGHWILGVALLNLGRCQAALKEYPAAEKNLIEAHTLLEKVLGPTHGRTLQARTTLAELYDAWGRPGDARRWRGTE